MRSKSLHILVLLWQALWLSVVVPGHTRGQIVLPGFESVPMAASDEATGKLDGWKAAGGSCCMPTPVGDSDDDRPRGNPSRCAVCHVAAMLMPAMAVDFSHPPLALLGSFEPGIVAAHERSGVDRYGDARAPPAMDSTVL